MDSLDQFKKALPIATFQGVPADLVRKRRVYGNNPARLTQFDCQKTADHVMMRCGSREAAHCAGFHQISPRCWWTRNRNGSTSVHRAWGEFHLDKACEVSPARRREKRAGL